MILVYGCFETLSDDLGINYELTQAKHETGLMMAKCLYYDKSIGNVHNLCMYLKSILTTLILLSCCNY